jgi:putative transposase
VELTFLWLIFSKDTPNDLLIRHIDTLRQVVKDTRKHWHFHIDAWVVLPDHLHCVWTLPKGDNDNSNRWRVITPYRVDPFF